MAIYQLGDRIPRIDPSAYVHETAVVIGDVRLGPGVSLWPHAVLRGDNEPIVVGAGSNIQEACALHTDEGIPLTVGEGVTVGHHAVLHGCHIGDGTLVGIQAVVLNAAEIGRECLLGAGCLVTERRQVPPRSLVLGSPARVVRALLDEEVQRMRENTLGYQARGRHYASALRRLDGGPR